jgi:hypothetical protein
MMAPSVPQAVQSCHELLLWLIPQLDKFPRVRFTLGERIEMRLLRIRSC